MKKTIILLLALLVGATARGQEADPTALPEIIPPSPEVSALLDFNLSKANEYTGSVGMSIPIYTISKGNIQLPISLGYQSSGTMVDKIASRVGMDWSLNAGGAIARTIFGGADEKGSSSYFSERMDTSLTFVTEQGYIDYGFNCFPFADDLPDDEAAIIDNRFELMSDLASGKADSQPDMFSYTLPNGQAGKFLFKKNKFLKKIQKDNLKISNPFNSNQVSPKEWEIVDDQGVTYYFTQTEIMYGGTECGGGGTPHNYEVDPNLFTAWYLTRIVSANGQDIVEIEYYVEEQIYDLSYTSQKIEYPGGTPNENEEVPTKEGANCIQYAVSLTPLVKKIQTNWGVSVDFIKSSVTRLDMEGDTYSLEKILVYKDNKKIHDFRLGTSYFQAQKRGRALAGNDTKNFRLRLDEIWQVGENDEIMPPYKFNYIDNGNYPNRLSLSQDYWGYYNGANNNNLTGFIPAYSHELEGIIGANRYPDMSYAEEGVLSSIEYPNGGATEYLYEANEIANEYHPDFDGRNFNFLSPYSATERTKELQNIALDVEGEVSVDFIVDSPEGNGYVLVDYLNAYLESDLDDGEAIPIIVDDETQESLPYLEMSISGNGISPLYFLPEASQSLIYLPNGTYTAKIKITDDRKISQACNMMVQWYSYGDYLRNLEVGGIRVKKETKKDGLGKMLIHDYQYLLDDGTLFSSGTLFRRISFNYDESVNATMNGAGIVCSRRGTWPLDISNSSFIKPFGIQGGNLVGYSLVEKKSVDLQGNINGKATHIFLNRVKAKGGFGSRTNPDGTTELYAGGNHYFQNPSLFYEHNGALLEQRIYAASDVSSNPSFILKSSAEYVYEEVGLPETLYNIKVKQFEDSGCKQCGTIRFETGFYWHTLESQFKMTQEINRVYDDVDNILETSTNYSYDYTLGYPKNMYKSLSTGGTITTTYTYPTDLASTGNIYQEMKDRNIVSSPIISETKRDGMSISKVRTEYDLFGTSILPKTIYTERAGSAEESRLQYYSYDTKGNPLEFSKEDDAHVSIIWDNLQLRPIAKAVNASHNQIWHTSFEEEPGTGNGIVDGGWTGAKAKNNPSINVPSLPAGEYICSYWKKSAGEWELVEYEFSITTQGYSTSLFGIIDEIRIFPKGAQMNTVTYDLAGRKLTECDANGHVIRYAYDGFGRLLSAKDEYDNLLKAYDYKYHNE